MPALTSGDHDDVDIGALQQLPVIVVIGTGRVAIPRIDRGDIAFPGCLVDIANSGHAHIGLRKEAAHVAASLPADADRAEHDLLAGRHIAIPPQGGGWHDGWESRQDAAGETLQKFTPPGGIGLRIAFHKSPPHPGYPGYQTSLPRK